MHYNRRRTLIAAIGRALPALLATASLFGAQAADRKAAQKSEQKLRFVVYGDTRDGHAVHRKLVALILKQNPDFVLQTGDLVKRGSDDSLWKIYDDITRDMRGKIPLYPARGNHDLGGPGYEERVTAPFTSGNKLYYSFDRGNCHFSSVDCFSPLETESEQYRWLDRDLAAAQKRGKLLFVFFHVAPYSIGSHGSNVAVRKTLCPLFDRYHVTTVFSGHDHLYYHTVRNGIPYIVSGGGGAPLYPAIPEKGAVEGDKYESVNHIVVCDVLGDSVVYTVLRADGSVLEKFALAIRTPAQNRSSGQ